MSQQMSQPWMKKPYCGLFCKRVLDPGSCSPASNSEPPVLLFQTTSLMDMTMLRIPPRTWVLVQLHTQLWWQWCSWLRCKHFIFTALRSLNIFMPAYIPKKHRFVSPSFMVLPNLCLQLDQAHETGRIWDMAVEFFTFSRQAVLCSLPGHTLALHLSHSLTVLGASEPQIQSGANLSIIMSKFLLRPGSRWCTLSEHLIHNLWEISLNVRSVNQGRKKL